MKKLFFFAAAIVAMVCASCENLRSAYGVNGFTQVVSKDTKEGIRYGIGRDQPNDKLKAETPVVFSDYAVALPSGFGGYFMYLPGKKTYYLFDSDGRDVLSGKKATSPDLEGLVPIINNGKEHHLTEVEMYYRHIVGFRYVDGYQNRYFILPVEGGNVYGVIYNGRFAAFGPFKKIFFGLYGFMFQDPTTGKWGASTLEHPIWEGEYDEIIEVEKSDEINIWFARKGNVWYSKQVVTATNIKNIPVDQRLLNQVCKMKINQTVKSAKKNWVKILAHGQRVGNNEASFAHLQ